MDNTQTQPATPAPLAALDLSPFCGRGVPGFDYHCPFVKRDRRYATNAFVCVRVPAPGVPDDTADNLPPVAMLFDGFNAGPPRWVPWPAPVYERGTVQCTECDGGHIDCDACGGSGCEKCRNTGWRLDDAPCPVCDGEAKPLCVVCRGAGHPLALCPACGGQYEYEGDVRIAVAGGFVAARHGKLIRTLPGPLMVAAPSPKWPGVLRFTFAGGLGEGLVAAMAESPKARGKDQC